MSEQEAEILTSYIEIADCHDRRIKSAIRMLVRLEPFTKDNIKTTLSQDTAALDSLIYRFDCLLKNIEHKIFPALLKGLSELNPDDTYLDRLNKLEKYNILPSSGIWLKMIDSRDQIEKEYFSLDPQNLVEALNRFIGYSRVLLEYWDEIKSYILDFKKNYYL